MGRMMGLEPTNTGTTIRGLNHLATPAVAHSSDAKGFIFYPRGAGSSSPRIRFAILIVIMV
jgi:hypothetical protein